MDVLEMRGDHLMEIKAAALKSLTSIIHLDRNPNFPKLNTIIDVTGAASYHGFLLVMVRNCISSLTGGSSQPPAATREPFPQPLATALFSFLYHLASYEARKVWRSIQVQLRQPSPLLFHPLPPS